jgi:hypothetical protein
MSDKPSTSHRGTSGVAVDFRGLLTGGNRPLQPPEDEAMWQPFADAMGLTPYVCKASFTCGVLRELIASAGLCLGQPYHLGALFLALDATELVGRCVGGFRERRGQAGERLRAGLRYLRGSTPGPAHSVTGSKRSWTSATSSGMVLPAPSRA